MGSVVRVNVDDILVCVLDQILSVLSPQESGVVDDVAIPDLPHYIENVHLVPQPLLTTFNELLKSLGRVSGLLLGFATALTTTIEQPLQTSTHEAGDTEVSEVAAEEVAVFVATYSDDFVRLDFLGQIRYA